MSNKKDVSYKRPSVPTGWIVQPTIIYYPQTMYIIVEASERRMKTRLTKRFRGWTEKQIGDHYSKVLSWLFERQVKQRYSEPSLFIWRPKELKITENYRDCFIRNKIALALICDVYKVQGADTGRVESILSSWNNSANRSRYDSRAIMLPLVSTHYMRNSIHDLL